MFLATGFQIADDAEQVFLELRSSLVGVPIGVAGFIEHKFKVLTRLEVETALREERLLKGLANVLCSLSKLNQLNSVVCINNDLLRLILWEPIGDFSFDFANCTDRR